MLSFLVSAASAANAPLVQLSTIILREVGNNNPLAVTQYALLAAAPTLPIAYMQAVDRGAYGAGGLAGSFLADAMIALTACAILALLFWLVRGRYAEQGLQQAPTPRADSTAQYAVADKTGFCDVSQWLTHVRQWLTSLDRDTLLPQQGYEAFRRERRCFEVGRSQCSACRDHSCPA